MKFAVKFAVPQDGAKQLAPHPFRVELVGSLHQLAFPSICANCGAPSSGSLTVRKPFVDEERGLYSIGEASVPYCDACIRDHSKESDSVPALRRLLACFGAHVIFAAVGAGLLALFLFTEAFGKLDTHSAGATPLFGFGGVMALIAWGAFRTAHRRTEPFVIPVQSHTTLAFDFSDNLSSSLQPERRVYAMRNALFAKEFGELNRQATWDPQGPVARQADRSFGILVGIAIVFGQAMWLLG
jgi:hypothetical protein